MSLLRAAQRMGNDCSPDSPDFDALTRLIALINLAEALCHVFNALEEDDCAAVPGVLRGIISRIDVELGRGG